MLKQRNHLAMIVTILDKIHLGVQERDPNNPHANIDLNLRINEGTSTIDEHAIHQLVLYLQNVDQAFRVDFNAETVKILFDNYITMYVKAAYINADRLRHYICTVEWRDEIPLYSTNVTGFGPLVDLTDNIWYVCSQKWSLAGDFPIPMLESAEHFGINNGPFLYSLSDPRSMTKKICVIRFPESESIPMSKLTYQDPVTYSTICNTMKEICGHTWTICQEHREIEEVRNIIKARTPFKIEQQNFIFLVEYDSVFNICIDITGLFEDEKTIQFDIGLHLRPVSLLVMHLADKVSLEEVMKHSDHLLQRKWTTEDLPTGKFQGLRLDIPTIRQHLSTRKNVNIVLTEKHHIYLIAEIDQRISCYLSLNEEESAHTKAENIEQACQLLENLIKILEYT